MSYIPTAALVTACVPGCPSRVGWVYEPGYPDTRWEPGQPDGFYPADYACYEEHLDRLVDDLYEQRLSELYRLAYQWEQFTEAGRALKWQSEYTLQAQVGLGGRIRRTRPVIPPPTEDDLVF